MMANVLALLNSHGLQQKQTDTSTKGNCISYTGDTFFKKIFSPVKHLSIHQNITTKHLLALSPSTSLKTSCIHNLLKQLFECNMKITAQKMLLRQSMYVYSTSDLSEWCWLRLQLKWYNICSAQCFSIVGKYNYFA